MSNCFVFSSFVSKKSCPIFLSCAQQSLLFLTKTQSKQRTGQLNSDNMGMDGMGDMMGGMGM